MLLIIIASLISFIKIVPAGYRGVMLHFGAVQHQVLDEGLHLKIPFYRKIKLVPVRVVKYEVKTENYSKDIQTVDGIIALNYHVKPDLAAKVYQELGPNYEDTYIHPAIQESCKAATAKFAAQQLIEDRPQVKDAIKVALHNRLSTYFVVDEFSIINFEFSSGYEKSVEDKQIAQQNALKAENDLKRVEFEAKQRVEQAKAEAEAIKIQAAAITQQGGPDYVQLKAIEKWDGKLPQQFIPGTTLPFLNLSK